MRNLAIDLKKVLRGALCYGLAQKVKAMVKGINHRFFVSRKPLAVLVVPKSF
mgnify:CR=1 FL=1